MPRKKKVLNEPVPTIQSESMEQFKAGEIEDKPVQVKTDEKDPMYDDVKVTIPVHLGIAGVDYPPGTHIVKRHQLETILEMVNKKQRANLAIFTGGSYLVEKMVGGALKVTQVEELDMNKMVRK